ncbi:TetR/AcrR family transcriptional regulator [Streptomyces bohaiensis]|uniref:TetR/AcrR family transcriptional regulator n=1 Tax=Streptomyces bohaiensis TaxID=1431344 RepID=A0ABX1CAS0_9ACTN|nr:TetR/AcrR family transcriptional regulator [Streptomyces bohaiensis]NJQ16201.1 TetR/AcrR family transcriptional regulator [Streptomyces bohaiensis]
MTEQPGVTAPRAGSRSGRTKLTEEREQELYEAVLAELRERGYEALTMDAVAARSRSSKATLYRQWQTKTRLVTSALRHAKRLSLDDVDTGSLRGDLREMCGRVGAEAPDDTAVIHALSHACRNDPDLHLAVRQVIIDPEIEVLERALRRAEERGELAPGNPAAEFVVHSIIGALIARPLMEGRYPDSDFLRRFADTMIIPLLLPESEPAG